MTAKPAIDDAGDAGLLNHSEKTRITSGTHGVAQPFRKHFYYKSS